MSVISNDQMKAMLKTVYMSGVTNAKYQNSPVLAAIGKEKFTGKEMKYAMQYGNGGNFGSVYSTVANNRTGGAKNMEWSMEPGYAFGLFNIDQPEILSSGEERGAYMKILANKMEACFDGLSKVIASYMYGGSKDGLGKFTSAVASIAASNNKATVTPSTALKLDIDTRFTVKGLSNVYFTVTGIDDNTITFDASQSGGAIAEGDIIDLYTAFAADGSFRGIEGLADILPVVDGDRTGDDWNTYIAKEFRGFDRSKAVNRLAGQFVKAAASGATRLSDALVSLLKKTKRANGLQNIVIVNDETWDAIGAELGIQRNLWQATNNTPSKQGVTLGLNELATAFGDAFIGRTVIDPYCPEDRAYMLDKDDLKFYDMGNVGKVIQPVDGNRPEVGSVGDQGFGDEINAKLNMDKLFTITPDSNGEYGPEFTIAANIFGNFALRKTASSGVAVLK